ncbi:MAG: sulfotransferase [Acidobacteriota bacterium]|nr:sulfotransferase [Acidobacteriota bacterium]
MQNEFHSSLLVVAGFPRTGTTSIYRNLELHPDFAVPVRKELNFFSRANQPLASYKAHFSHHQPGQICVDVSPLYSLDPAVAARLRAAVPQARVVLLVREPASWIQSTYTQMCSYTPHPPSLAQFVERPVLKHFNPEVTFSLKEGVYRRSLAAFGSAFGDNLLIIDFAAFERNPLAILSDIETFAGALRYFTGKTVDVRRHNSSRLARRYPPQLRRLLSQESLIQVATRVVPAPLLRRARSMLYYEGRTSESVPTMTQEDEHDATITRAATAADRETYAELFRTAPVRRGSDLPWED